MLENFSQSSHGCSIKDGDDKSVWSRSSFELNKELSKYSSLTRSFSAWEQELQTDFDKNFILHGISQGFEIVPDGAKVGSVDCGNYDSALNPKVKPLFDKLFQQEIFEGKLSVQDFKPKRIQSIGAVQKKEGDTPRPITDCSRPYEDPLNHYIETETFSLESLDDALITLARKVVFTQLSI